MRLHQQQLTLNMYFQITEITEKLMGKHLPLWSNFTTYDMEADSVVLNLLQWASCYKQYS